MNQQKKITAQMVSQAKAAQSKRERKMLKSDKSPAWENKQKDNVGHPEPTKDLNGLGTVLFKDLTF